MIGLEQLGRIVRENDAEMMADLTNEGYSRWLARFNIVEKDMIYMAQQRALRAALRYDGQDHILDSQEKVPVTLSPVAEAMHASCAATWIDGFAAGLKCSLLPKQTGQVPDGQHRRTQ